MAIPTADLTNAQFRRMVEINIGFLRRDDSAITAQLAAAEEQVRDMLQLIVGAMDEGALSSCSTTS